MSTASTRVPQQERSRATRARLLEATVDCLVEYGWSGTTTTVVAWEADDALRMVAHTGVDGVVIGRGC
ncbi:hypothetical protein AB0F73_25240, partial [Micromonospora purpureochromogenes]